MLFQHEQRAQQPAATAPVKKLNAAETRNAIDLFLLEYKKKDSDDTSAEWAEMYRRVFADAIPEHPEWRTQTVRQKQERIERMIRARAAARIPDVHVRHRIFMNKTVCGVKARNSSGREIVALVDEAKIEIGEDANLKPGLIEAATCEACKRILQQDGGAMPGYGNPKNREPIKVKLTEAQAREVHATKFFDAGTIPPKCALTFGAADYGQHAKALVEALEKRIADLAAEHNKLRERSTALLDWNNKDAVAAKKESKRLDGAIKACHGRCPRRPKQTLIQGFQWRAADVDPFPRARIDLEYGWGAEVFPVSTRGHILTADQVAGG